MLARDWAHKRRVQQYGKTDYLSTVAQAEHSHRRDLLLLISSSYGLTFLTTQAPINTHDAAVSRYAAHAKRTKAHAPTWKHTCAHTLHTPVPWAWSSGVDLSCFEGHIAFLTVHGIICTNNYASAHTWVTRLVFTSEIICSGVWCRAEMLTLFFFYFVVVYQCF